MFRHSVEPSSPPQPAAAAVPDAAAASMDLPPLPPPPRVLPSTPPLGGLLGHMPGHIPFVITPAMPHAIPAIIERPAIMFNSPSPPPPPINAHQQHQHQPSHASVASAAAAASSAHSSHVQFTSPHHPATASRGAAWFTTDYSQAPHHAPATAGATMPLARRRWDAPPPIRAPLSASFVPASTKLQHPPPVSAPSVKQPAPSMPFQFHLPTGAPAAAAASASGASASTAICLEDSEPMVTAASVVAHQTLSLADSSAFVHASFASDEMIHRQKLPLVDPLTLARISIPVRSRHCHHVRCLDLDTILMQAADAASRSKPLRCPICNEGMALQDLVVDSFIKMRLEEGAETTLTRA